MFVLESLVFCFFPFCYEKPRIRSPRSRPPRLPFVLKSWKYLVTQSRPFIIINCDKTDWNILLMQIIPADCIQFISVDECDWIDLKFYLLRFKWHIEKKKKQNWLQKTSESAHKWWAMLLRKNIHAIQHTNICIMNHEYIAFKFCINKICHRNVIIRIESTESKKRDIIESRSNFSHFFFFSKCK